MSDTGGSGQVKGKIMKGLGSVDGEGGEIASALCYNLGNKNPNGKPGLVSGGRSSPVLLLWGPVESVVGVIKKKKKRGHGILRGPPAGMTPCLMVKKPSHRPGKKENGGGQAKARRMNRQTRIGTHPGGG